MILSRIINFSPRSDQGKLTFAAENDIVIVTQGG